MMYKTIAFLALFLVSSTVADEDLFGNFSDMDMDFNISIPCDEEFEAADACFTMYNCTEACDMDDDDGTDDGTDDDLFSNFDPTNTTAIKAAFKQTFDSSCAESKEQICLAKDCCPSCADAMASAIACVTNEAIPEMQDMLQSMFDGVGDLLDGVLASANEFLGDAGLNETVAPVGGLFDGFDGFFETLTCDLVNVTCDDEMAATNSTPMLRALRARRA